MEEESKIEEPAQVRVSEIQLKQRTPKKETKMEMIEACCICVDDFDVNSETLLIYTKCKHLFHETCLRQWVNTQLKVGEEIRLDIYSREIGVSNPECPSCRTTM